MSPAEKLLFAERLYEARQSLGWSQREAAKRIGIPHSRLAEFEMGTDSHTGKHAIPDYEKVVKIARVYDLPTDEMLRLAGYEPCIDLSDDEQAVIADYRSLSGSERLRMRQQLDLIKIEGGRGSGS